MTDIPASHESEEPAIVDNRREAAVCSRPARQNIACYGPGDRSFGEPDTPALTS